MSRRGAAAQGSARASGLVLALLMLLPLVPLAEAAGPEPRPWSGYNAGTEVGMVALAREGSTIAASLRAPPTTPSPGVPGVPSPSTTRTDVAVFDFESGFATNFRVAAVAPDGRTHVAVSRDGLAIASLRRETIVTAGASQQHIQLHYARIPAGTNWSAGPSFERAISFGLVDAVIPIGVALSERGDRVAALVAEGTNYVLRGYGATASSLDSAFEIRAPGAPRALATSGDLSRMMLAGQFPQGNFTYGGFFVLQFAQADPLASYFDTTANNTDARGAAMSRDGATIALGGGDGRLHLFKNARDALPLPTTLSLGGTPVSNITMSEDGTRLASATGAALTTVNTEGLTPTVIWNTTVSGAEITALAMNRTGALLVVGTAGTGGGVHAFSDVDSTLLWSIPGDTRGVALDAAGTRVAYAQRSAVGAARIPRALTMELLGGGKIAPTQIVAVPGVANVSVSLRNDGAALERVVFEESTPDISLVSEEPVVSVRPGAIVRANLTLNVDTLVGPRVFNVTARSLTSGAIDNVTLSVTPRPTLDVKLSVNATDLLAEPGRASEILLTIVNNGTGDAPVAIRATQTVSGGPLWDLSISETQLTALRGTRSSVRVTMTPPADAPNGTSAVATFTLEGQDIFDVARVSFRINPELKVEVNATGVTKFIEPGRRAFYNVTVTNIGSLPRDFDVFFTIIESSNRNWGVDMATDVVRLDPLAKRTFAVSITAPADSLPQERVAVLVSARSIPELPNETVVQDNVTLYGIAVPPKVTTTTTPNNGIPFVAPLATLAVLLILAAFGPRRRRP